MESARLRFPLSILRSRSRFGAPAVNLEPPQRIFDPRISASTPTVHRPLPQAISDSTRPASLRAGGLQFTRAVFPSGPKSRTPKTKLQFGEEEYRRQFITSLGKLSLQNLKTDRDAACSDSVQENLAEGKKTKGEAQVRLDGRE